MLKEKGVEEAIILFNSSKVKVANNENEMSDKFLASLSKSLDIRLYQTNERKFMEYVSMN